MDDERIITTHLKPVVKQRDDEGDGKRVTVATAIPRKIVIEGRDEPARVVKYKVAFRKGA